MIRKNGINESLTLWNLVLVVGRPWRTSNPKDRCAQWYCVCLKHLCFRQFGACERTRSLDEFQYVVYYAEHSEQILSLRALNPNNRCHSLLPTRQCRGPHQRGECAGLTQESLGRWGGKVPGESWWITDFQLLTHHKITGSFYSFYNILKCINLTINVCFASLPFCLSLCANAIFLWELCSR